MISINNLKFKYKSNEIFNMNTSLNINEGINFLLGNNGSGKTTFFKILMNMLELDDGDIVFDNEKFDNICENIGFTFDFTCFFKRMNAIENFSCLNEFRNIKADIAFFKKLLVKFDLNENTIIENYSLGMKKKLSIIFSIVFNQKYIFLDEPFNGIDLNTRELLINLLEEIKVGSTILISTHDPIILKEIEGKIYIIKNKEIIEEDLIL